MRRGIISALLVVVILIGAAFAEVLVDGGVALNDEWIVEYGSGYSQPGEVALYLYVFNELPSNYITKSEARELGWISSEGNLWDVCYGMSIGGDYFGNREGLLPTARDRKWYECDVNYYGGYRGAERIVYSSDGMILYSSDHYQSYDILYENWYEEEQP